MNSEKERENHLVKETTISLWEFINVRILLFSPLSCSIISSVI